MSTRAANAADIGTRLGGAKGLLERGLRHRALAVLAGTAAASDFQALFQGLRFRSRGRRRFRDIADFIAHPEVRDRGAIAELVRDVFTSARVFTMIAAGQAPSSEEARLAGHANLRLATDAAISGQCAMGRKAAGAAIDRAASILEHGLLPTDRDAFVFNSYCNRLKWHPAFHDHELLDEFTAVLRDNKLLEASEVGALRRQANLLTLFVLAQLHGVEVELTTGETVTLQAGFFNRERRLEIKAHLTFSDLAKPIFMPLCVFLTHIQPEVHCDNQLLHSETYGWDMPITLIEGELRALA